MVRLAAVAALAALAIGTAPAAAAPPGMTVDVQTADSATGMTAGGPPGMTPETVALPPKPTATTAVPAYRIQTLAADGLAVVFLIAAFQADYNNADSLAKLSLGTYLLGAPLVHAYHGRTGTAVASLGIRVGLPLLGGLLGASQGQHQAKCYDYCDSSNNTDGAVLGVLGGIVAAIVIDSAYFARADEVHKAPSWSPSASASSGGFSLGVAGAF